MGFVGYYRCYCPNFSSLAQPLNKLLSKDTPWEWGSEQRAAVAQLKAELTVEGKILRHINPSLPFVLHTDWSQRGICGVLGQVEPGTDKEYMVACVSRSLNKHERNYSSYQGEMLAAVWAIKTLRPYLHGADFTVVTDHKPLEFLMTSRTLTGQAARWALSLQDYTFQVLHRPGITHQNADFPSRQPRGDSGDYTGARLDGPARRRTT